ncbi:GNAT family N-acetyltransferase [Nonomuraea sp. NPDC049152]|uniref:GNAT family N-acetyltransferase n=1 Tax=Nonomuraea sp. NPDC049152 TaxID=3154350 RepID=UPI0033E6C371
MGPHEIARAALTFDAAEAPALVDRLMSPPATRRWTTLATDGGFAVASLSERDPTIGHLDLLAVHPDAQGKGRGRELVAAAEEWLRAEGATQARFAGNPPAYAWPGIDVRYTAAACLAESAGYERYSIAWNMTATLPVPSAEEAPRRPGVRLHACGPDEDRSHVVAFVEREWNKNWAWEVANATGLHYATLDGEVVAFAAWGARPTWFGPMGTAPAARGLGLGGVLLRRCLADQHAAGLTEAQIGWVGPLRFYSRAVGARAERVFWLYQRDLR